jgi:manganese/zinc/iron transport system ATP- binding protein
MTLLPAHSPLAVRGLSVTYGEKPAVEEVNATFPAAALSAIIGPNGAGKSTFLKACLGVVPSLAGQVRIFGQTFAAARARVAYVPQRASVDWEFPATVLDVVQMGQYRRAGLWGRLSGSSRGQAMGCLDRVGMADFAARQIGQLSGGQQQRVFLARALAQEADLYLLDEPFAGVDAATERAIVEVLRDLRADGKSVIAVHHDLATVADYFDHVFLINVTRMAEGPVTSTFTPENLHATYGGRLGFLGAGPMSIQAAE